MRIHNPTGKTKAEVLAAVPKSKREAFLKSLTEEERIAFYYDWSVWGRKNQQVPTGDWMVWLILAGRGFGKTRAGAESIKWAVNNGYRNIGIAGATAHDLRDIIVEGVSGILRCYPPDQCPKYEPSKRRITWANGAKATLLSADEPQTFRGFAYDYFWGDELVKWPHLDAAWANIMMGLREPGKQVQAILTTTPQPLPLFRELMQDDDCIVTKGTIFDNKANLSPKAIAKMVAIYGGTSLGRQELEGELLGSVPGALWQGESIDDNRVKSHPELKRIVVAIDPSANQGNKDACECGIVVAGLGFDNHCYILADKSGSYSPLQWVAEAWKAYVDHSADRIVYEANLAGAIVDTTFRLQHPHAPLKAVYATKGKAVRAEPVSALYERGTVHHVGMFKDLEDQLTTWTPGKKSPDRLDALVWAVTELALGADPIDASAFDNFNQNDYRRSFQYDSEEDSRFN